MRKRGEITVFLSLCLLCVFALLCVLVESARMAGSRYYFQTAVNGALDNLFSRYHRRLWQEYRILGLPCESEEDMKEQVSGFVGKYLETDNWYPMDIADVEVKECVGLTGQGGDYLAQEITDYMKYGVWSSLAVAPEQGEQFLNDMLEASGAGTMADAYQDQAEMVQGLETVVEDITDCVRNQESLADTVASRLAADDAEGFHDSAEAFRREANRMDRLMADYEAEMETLKAKIEETEAEFAQIAGDFQQGRAQLFEEQMAPYRAYVDDDGERRLEIMGQWEAGKENLELLGRTESMVDELVAEYETELEEYEAAQRESAGSAGTGDAGELEDGERSEGGAAGGAGDLGEGGAGPNETADSGGDGMGEAVMEGPEMDEPEPDEPEEPEPETELEEPEETELEEPEPETELEEPELSLGSAAELWAGFRHSALDMGQREGDAQKQGFLDQVMEMAGGGIMELVLPEGMSVSSATLPEEGLPSEEEREESIVKPGPIDLVLIHEYCGHFFTNALSEEKKPVQYELEYLMHGGDTDRKNLEAVASQLLLVRQGLNLIHILSDSAKRGEARELALLIVGASGIMPLVEVTAFAIMGVWAAGEAIMDLRSLFAGEKVPLWKSGEDWKLSLNGLLSMGKQRICPESSETGQKGLGYEDYLKLLMFLTDYQEIQMRILDLLEMNLQRQEEDFSIEKCVYRVELCGKASGKPLFFRLPIVENFIGETDVYQLEAPAQRAY